ncbi:MAG TPA: ribosome small subunit-dependent GTPase A [Micromonosporaceae bacterium]
MTFDLASVGWDADLASAYRRFDRPGHLPARVTRVDQGVCTALAATGPVRSSLSGSVLAAAARDPRVLPCAGDWVVLCCWPDQRVTLDAVLPRRTAIVRGVADRRSVGQVLAANVDLAAVVEPMDPEPDPGRIERLLALAWESGAQPLVVLTKADLAADPVAVAGQVAECAPGVPVYPVSVARGDGLADLRALVAPNRTLGLLGRSGAGKSSLVNALAGATVMATQRIRRADGRGRHTTTYRALVPLPGGGAVLDTPGLRGVGLFDAADGIDRTFADVDAFAAGCRFADCAHFDEPDCAVRAAVERGELSVRRLESWHKLRREQAWQTRRRERRLAAEARAQSTRSRRGRA